ncbi:hypothetical protein ABK858_05155 [Enterobacter hormaechei]|nr:hypothetical protein [Enterobacter hormaechei]KTI09861.1 hypothetical protein ASV12_25330 [Enterobacter hormaechei subsp. xiangfangensis]KTI92967.1 hypothetical protein ASU94_09775 [Enterobacter hormaechei subsp. xiangfangensis]
MKTFTIGWLNKCRCGNKSHSVKTARGNESALWDDDAVKCNSCGRGGVIQVCEGQARVLWETDEEMAEGKPMSTITKEQAQSVSDLKAGYTLGHADVAILNELARIALASLEAEAVGEVVLGEYDDCGCHPDAKVVCIAADGQADWENFKDGTRLYTAPPAPVSVPAAMEMDDDFDSAFEHGKAVGWNAYRAAMLQGAKPVTTAYKLRDAVETIRNSGIEIDAEKIFAERDALNAPDCWCRTCRPVTISDMRFVVCPECGNKRCPHANDHRNACTGSNEPGQEGSAYPAAPQQEVTQALAKGMERYGDAMQELAQREMK